MDGWEQEFDETKLDVLGVFVVWGDEANGRGSKGVDGPAEVAGDGVGVLPPSVAVGLGGRGGLPARDGALDGVGHGFLAASKALHPEASNKETSIPKHHAVYTDAPTKQPGPDTHGAEYKQSSPANPGPETLKYESVFQLHLVYA